MLTLTDNAMAEIRNLIDNPDVPEGSGIRIAADPAAGGLSLALAVTPAEDDEVLEDAGARVFLDPQAAMMLDGKALDAHTGEGGQLRFDVTEPGVTGM